jgi:hypothetical protein
MPQGFEKSTETRSRAAASSNGLYPKVPVFSHSRFFQLRAGKKSFSGDLQLGGRADDSTVRGITFGEGTILEFPVLRREFDLKSHPVPFRRSTERKAQYVRFCKCLVLNCLVALTGIEPGFAGFSCFL